MWEKDWSQGWVLQEAAAEIQLVIMRADFTLQQLLGRAICIRAQNNNTGVTPVRGAGQKQGQTGGAGRWPC